jgi:hypothetical protein
MIIVKAVLAVVLPISSVTSGAIDTNITQTNIDTTICKSGYTATVRPPVSYTNKLKAQQLNGTYKQFTDKVSADYEEDHLISLEIGGSPTDPKNLWPQPYAGIGARIKDQVENKLHDLVCSHKMLLTQAQKEISTNWYTAYLKYVKGNK